MGCDSSKPRQVELPKSVKYLETGQNEEYDARIICESFYSVLTGKSWPIEIKNWAEYQKQSKKNTSQIAVLGYEKMGKSFLLSKIMDRTLPQGKHTKTTGVCVLYSKDEQHPWTALDTPGTNVSVKLEKLREELDDYFKSKGVIEEDKMRMLFGDNILMEALLQEFVVHNAQVILIVINKLRRDDQRLISRIQHLPNKRVIIVHNLHESWDLRNVEDIIRDDVKASFEVKERAIQSLGNSKNNIIYLEDDEKKTEHVILAHDGSPAGKYYNEATIQYIRDVIDQYNHSDPFDLVEAFNSHLNTYIRKYLALSLNNEENTNVVIDGEQFKLTKDNNGMAKGIMLSNSRAYNLKLSTANEFGNVHTYTREGLESVPFSVKKFSRYTDTGAIQHILQIEFEVAGACFANQIHCKVDETESQVKIIIFGTSHDNSKGDASEVILKTTRKFGSFTIVTDFIPIMGFTINKAERPMISQRVPGLVTMAFVLYELGVNVS